MHFAIINYDTNFPYSDILIFYFCIPFKDKIKALQALHHAPSLHLHQACAITVKNEIKGRCISLSLNKVDKNI